MYHRITRSHTDRASHHTTSAIRRALTAGLAMALATLWLGANPATASTVAAPLATRAAAAAPATAKTATSTAPETAGAPVPFTEYAAVHAATNGTKLAPDYNFGSLASEATGRRAVELVGLGQYVAFTLKAPANAVDFHYAIPDSLTGGGLTDPLDLYVNSTLTTSLSLTSALSWLYGPYQFTNTPSVGEADTDVPHDFYNDVRYKFSSTLPAGTVVKLQVDQGDDAPWYVINTADFQKVAAPVPSPSGYINVTQPPYNVDNTGATDVTSALQNAINAASSAGTGVYLPQGTYQISQPLNVNNVSVAGAGEWYTELTGSNVEFAGQIGSASTNVHVSNLSIFGNVSDRNDSDGQVNGFNGGFSNSTISNVWIQNTKVGAWIVGPVTNLTISHLRIQDTTADGINFDAADGAITSSTIEDNFLRNTQDDGLALWSQNAEDSGITITHNTVDSPGLANNIGIYGSGDGDTVSDNLLQDTVTRGGGIGIGQRFGAVPMNGTLTITGNTLARTGQFDPGWNYGVGAIWFWPQQGNMNSTVNITNNKITNSPYEAFQFQNQNGYVGSQVTNPPDTGNSVSGVTISGNTVSRVGTFVFQDQAPGSATVSSTTAAGVGDAGVFTCGPGFTLTDGGGNSGFSTTACGMPAASPLWVYPTVTTFESANVGQATPAQQIAIMNTASSTASLGAISASSGFTVSQDPSHPCGTSLAPTVPASVAPWCMVDVSFTAPAAGITEGTLTINSNQPGSPATVRLMGSTGAVNNVINPPTLTPSSLTFGFQNVGSTSGAQTTTVTNPGQSTIAINSVTTTGPYADTTTCGTTLAAGASCTVSVTFAPTAGGAQNGTLQLANSATATPVEAVLTGTGVTPTTNLAASATMTASGYTAGYPPSAANDGNADSYWESTDNAFPQWLEADFGASVSVGSMTVDLPPLSDWPARTQTFSVQASSDGTTWTTIVPSAGYTFDPSTGNTVTISLPTTTLRYLRLYFTANTGWPAGQVSELEVFPGGGTGAHYARVSAR
ncbi:MAG TPA: discoidin domain-containing protein [Streptosporangiaceae bacterium]|nr:discoidin domain-containing protein [Streptosporangiaceae bacterium]